MRLLSLLILLLIALPLLGDTQTAEKVAVQEARYLKAYQSRVRIRFKDQKHSRFLNQVTEQISDLLSSRKFQKQFVQFKEERNYRNLPYISRWLLNLIQENPLGKRARNRAQICETIRQTTPDYPHGENCFGDLAMSQGKIKFWRYIKFYLWGFQKSLNDPLNHVTYLFHILYFLLGLFLLMFTILAVKYTRLLFHDIFTLFNLYLPNIESKILAAMILMIPLLFSFFPWIYILVGYYVLISLYLPKKLYPLAILILMSLWGIHTTVEALTAYPLQLSKQDKVVSQILYDDYYLLPNPLPVLKHDQRFKSVLAQAKYLKEQRQFTAAKKRYQKLIEKHQDIAFLHNNLGNILFFLKRIDQAIESYKTAININPGEPLYYYNLSKVYYRTRNQSQGNNYRKIAKDIDAAALNKFDQQFSFNFNRFLSDHFPEKYLNPPVSRIDLKKQTTHFFKQNLYPYSQRDFYISLFESLILGLFFFFTFRRKLNGRYCTKCGTSFNELETPVKGSEFCSACYHILNSRGRLDRSILIQEEQKVRRRRKRLQYITTGLNLILPGSLWLYKRHQYRGLFMMAFHLFYIIFWLFYQERSDLIHQAFHHLLLGFFTFVELTLYFFSFWHIRRS